MNEELQTASASERVREAYAQFLMSHPWDVFLTLTFDRRFANPQYGISPERADKDFRRLIRYVNEQLEGKRWMRKSSHKGVIWARAQEAHADGALHYHATLHSPSTPISPQLITAIREWWERRFGFARAEVPRSQEDVTRYLIKHMGNPGSAEMDFSYNFLMRC